MSRDWPDGPIAKPYGQWLLPLRGDAAPSFYIDREKLFNADVVTACYPGGKPTHKYVLTVIKSRSGEPVEPMQLVLSEREYKLMARVAIKDVDEADAQRIATDLSLRMHASIDQKLIAPEPAEPPRRRFNFNQ